VESARKELQGAVADTDGWHIALQRKEGCIRYRLVLVVLVVVLVV
jgi:hypothetical protein